MNNKTVKIIWKQLSQSGSVELINQGVIAAVDQKADQTVFSVHNGTLLVSVEQAMLDVGSYATIMTVRASNPFSFFVRDVHADRPIWIPEYDVCVTEENDERTYAQIVADITASGRQTKITKMESSPEESFRNAASHTRNMPCVTWLGMSRDIRLFEIRPHTTSDVSKPWDTIQPFYHHTPVKIPEMGEREIEYNYFFGRGIGCRQDMTRRLENGVMPILNVTSVDGEISYKQKMFVSYEKSELTAKTLHGTHYLVADLYAKSPTKRTEAQQAETDRVFDAEMNPAEEAVLYLQLECVNTSDAPKYAYVRLPQPCQHPVPAWTIWDTKLDDEGLGIYNQTGNVFMTCTLNGKPMNTLEYAVLLGAGEKAVIDIKLPHKPVSRERALALRDVSFSKKLDEAKAFWQAKLDRIAQIHLPERRIEEMMKAGFLHLDLVCFGNEPDDAVAPVVGVYTPIGTESTPIIQYIESMGDTKLAERAVNYFLKKQRDDGFMQNFSDYMSETGLGLYNCAKHFMLTGDKEWLRSVSDKLVKGCDYIREWTLSSMDEKLRRRGYGMIFGKVADCDYPYHSFMLNSTTYGGVKACADVLAQIDNPNAKRIAGFAEEYKKNILQTMEEAFAVAPVIPLADGSWCPAIAQWPEINGPMCLFANGGVTFSHGMMMECSENGCYDIMYGVVEPDSVFGSFIIKMVTELEGLENTLFSQPYYSVHPYVHLLRGETRSFLKEFYNNMSALADRETYSFWEHQYQESPHKTHEEAWFLMRCRWMLFMDNDSTLKLLWGVPRAWLTDGKIISFKNVNTRFGRLSVDVRSQLAANTVRANIHLERREGSELSGVELRIPHPNGQKPVSVNGGTYCAERESIILDAFDTDTCITVQY